MDYSTYFLSKKEMMVCIGKGILAGMLAAWILPIEVMCNEILGNYSKKEDQLMTAAFGTRPKRRLNRVLDALGFEYRDYENLNKGIEGRKRKRVTEALNEDEKCWAYASSPKVF